MQLLQKSTYYQTLNIDADPVKHLESSTLEYLHASFLLREYKRAYSKAEYRELLKQYSWDKGVTEQRRALKLAEHFKDFAFCPQALIQIPVTILLRLCSDKYKSIIEELKLFDDEDITCDRVLKLIEDRKAQIKKEKESQLPPKPSIWKRNCRGERYPGFPPVYEKDEQTGILTQKLMDEYGLTPQYILRVAIFDFYNKYILESVEESAIHDVDDVVEDKSESDDYDYNEPDIQPNQCQTVEEKWSELNQQLKVDIENTGEVSLNTGQLIFGSCQHWEAAVPTSKRWSAIANICGYSEKLLKYLSNYAYGNHSEWRHSWGAMLASYKNFEQELEWVPSIIRIDALIAMGYKIPATVEVKLGGHEGCQGRIVELHGDTTAPILVEFDENQKYFHWKELDIIASAGTFAHYTTVEQLSESKYFQEPSESDTELESTPLETAINVLINGSWEDIRDVFNQHPEMKEEAWSALNTTQRQRVIEITPEIVKVLNLAKKDGVISEYKEIAVGVYQVKLPGKILWEQRAYHEIEIRHYLKGWREKMSYKN
ncbi:hypothetical protein NIES267_72720 (plasmid) [Calothrix parasitica NIES-267]|uniref:Uncharacterized protein n=1 Tax=Calothrix parasitica NIES-267 TaxID=1973488 RepID=A0A1Z4M2Z0_9CYAN|nr:hypothetical protein NIES267_72720 [Calothrix parasitica NIES-267]